MPEGSLIWFGILGCLMEWYYPPVMVQHSVVVTVACNEVE